MQKIDEEKPNLLLGQNQSSGADPVLTTSTGDDGPYNYLSWDMILYSLFLFLLAGLFEIGGGWLIWKAMREGGDKALYLTVGSIVLVAYGFIPTLQPLTKDFGRIFAIYGGFFIVLSYVWSYFFDGFIPDLGDYVGSAIALVGVLLIWFWPR